MQKTDSFPTVILYEIGCGFYKQTEYFKMKDRSPKTERYK